MIFLRWFCGAAPPPVVKRQLSVFKTLIEHQAFVERFIQQGVDAPRPVVQ